MSYIFVTENYEIFSTGVSAREKQGQDKGGPLQGVIRSLIISSVGRPFWICSPVGFLNCNVLYSSLWIVQFLIRRKENDFRKPPVNAELLELVIKRRRANHSWRPSLKAEPNVNSRRWTAAPMNKQSSIPIVRRCLQQKFIDLKKCICSALRKTMRREWRRFLRHLPDTHIYENTLHPHSVNPLSTQYQRKELVKAAACVYNIRLPLNFRRLSALAVAITGRTCLSCTQFTHSQLKYIICKRWNLYPRKLCEMFSPD